MIYFDNAATTSVRPEVVAVYSKLLSDYGNPDSLHALGRKSHQNMEEARKRIAAMLHVRPDEILFTGSSSESNSLALIGYALANQSKGRHIITSNAEHSSIRKAVEFLRMLNFEVSELPIHEDGTVHAEDLKERLRPDTILVSVMHVNNETGAINPIGKLADLAHSMPKCKFHADCTQSFAKEEIPIEKLDMMSLSAHKIHGIKGSALLMKKTGVALMAIIQGGQQEQGLRGGTENAPANIALAKTIRLALEEQKEARARVEEISDFLKNEIRKLPGTQILSPKAASPYILSVSFDSMTSEVLMNALDQRGVCVSAKSTCSSHESGANDVLVKMGAGMKAATHNIRLSFSSLSTMEEAREFMKILKEILNQYGLPL